MYNLQLINIFMMNFEFSESSVQLHELLRLYIMTADKIDALDDYINKITHKMMEQSLSGYIGRASLLAQTKSVALGIQSVYFEYYSKLKKSIQAMFNNSGGFNTITSTSNPVPNSSQEIAYINKVLCMEFNSENRSS